MDESRLQRLEDQVGNLREDRAALAESVEHLTKSVEELSVTVQSLRDTMNTGRGALWAISSGAAALGAAGSWAASKLFGMS